MPGVHEVQRRDREVARAMVEPLQRCYSRRKGIKILHPAGNWDPGCYSGYIAQSVAQQGAHDRPPICR